MTFITSDPTAPYRHALNAWVSPLATCALPKGVCYLLTYLLQKIGWDGNRGRPSSAWAVPLWLGCPSFRLGRGVTCLQSTAMNKVEV